MKRTLPILCFLLSVLGLSAQNISGVVMASDSPDPVIGANVTVKGTSTGTITDFDGNFSIPAKVGDVLVVSFIGYKAQEVAVKSTAPLRVTLQPDNVLLDEVVAIGYGTMKKSDLTGAVTSVSAEDLVKAPVSGLDQALQGRAAGVTVISNSGQPGQGADIRIRGIGSALGGNKPLYVVDGVIIGDNISFLSPNDIQSMDILKDASAAAIYGSRGANGVILITTKTGNEGKANIAFDAYWGIQNRWKKLDLMSAQEQAETKLRIGAMKNGAEEIGYYMQNGFNKWMSMYNTGKSPYFPTIYDPVNNPTGFDYASQETDWQEEVFNPNAFMQNYNLSIDGGNDRGHYAFSANYFQQEGTIIGSNYQRLTLRINSDYKVREWLTIGEHLSFLTATSRWAMNNNASPGASVLSAALAMAPWDPTHYPEGSTNVNGEDISGKNAASSNFKNVTNPFSMISESFPNDQNERWMGDIYVEIRPIDGLTLRSAMSMDMRIDRSRSYKNAYNYSSYDQSNKNYLSTSMGRYCSLLEETTLTYAKEIDKHNFSVMVGQTWQEENTYSIGGAGASIMNPVEENWYFSNTTEDRTFSDGVSRLRRLSFLGRAFYSYDNRYMATVNFRADASSRFTKQPWGFFPSMSLAWRLSQESFMEGASTWLDNLKIRAGYGRVGNDDVPNGSFIPTMGTGMDVFYGYPLGLTPVIQPGAAVLTQVNVDGKWETNEQWDAAVDFSFWGSKLSGTVEYFRRNTLDALMYVKAPAQVGNMYDLIRNVGLIRNEGFELTLDHRYTVGKFSYNIGGNLSYIKNMLVETNGGSPLWGDRIKTDAGMPLNSFWGYEYEGIYQSDEEALEHLYSYTSETIGVHAGDAKYKDLNNDGKIDDNDQTYIGNPFPKLTYGLSLGADFYGVDIQLFFQGVYGNSVYNALRLRTEGAGDECTLSTSMRDVWVGYTPIIQNALVSAGVNYFELENRDGTIPNPKGSPMNTENSSRFVEDGSYLRLKNLQIGYTLPKDITKKFYVERLRVYMTASNLFTLTKYSGYDPEVGTYAVDYGNYPQSRTFTFGLNVNF